MSVQFCGLEYSGTSIQGTPSGPRKVFAEWKLGWALLIINQKNKTFFFYSALEY